VEKAVKSKLHALEDSCVSLALNDRLEAPADTLVGRSEAIRQVLLLVKKVAPTDSTVLVTGETGSGKELAARMIHRLSKRHGSPFVVVDCGSLVETLFESEMFGHKKGSFTGAIDTTKGKFEVAHGGTLFLDEITNINIEIQARLLRVIQEQEIFKVGSSRTKKVDVRIIAATNRDLLEEIRENRFRQDLFYRLNVVRIHIPPLRERTDDIPLLAEYFLEGLGRVMRRKIAGISDDAMKLLQAYEWPGNVRELKNVIERAIIVCERDRIVPDHLVLGHSPQDAPPPLSERGSLADMERSEILRTLKKCRGNKSHAAELLGIHRKTLREKMRKYDITFEE
jgi:transcriptional regulator with PAS, ATPase and Fis domain